MKKRIKNTVHGLILRHKHIVEGFTLVEILIVVGILAALLGIVLIALNPMEQVSRASDVAKKTVAQEVSKATNYYFTTEKSLPWKKNSTCREQIASGGTLDQLESCVEELTKGGDLETKILASTEAKDIYVNECADAIAICYNPKSQKFNQNAEAKYTKNGVINPDCPSTSGTSEECYACTFSTNDAQECFQALNPNGTLALSETADPNEVVPIQNLHSKKACDTPGGPGEAMCAADVVTNSAGDVITSLGIVGGLGPEELHKAYNLPCTPGGPVQSICPTPATFGPQTIAIVIAYHAPTVEADLAAFSTAYGIPQCTKANGCLSIVNQNGATSPLPAQNDLWALEAALDVQVAHMICQTCKILLVEANTNYMSDLAIAVRTAAQMGATAITNSYGAYEWPGSTTYDSYLNHPGVYVTAATGDWGYGSYYPAASRHVIAVGGTTLSVQADGSYSSENVWSGTGGGCAAYQNAGSYQTSLSNWSSTGCGSRRAIADVAAVGDPRTGVAIYNTTPYDGRVGWWKIGGTSLSSPLIAAALAMWQSAPTSGNTAAILYANTHLFRDVTTGSNGGCSNTIMCNGGVGYDGPTGIGSPNNLTFVNTSPSVTQTPTATPTVTQTPTPVPNPNSSQVWLASFWNIYRFHTDGTTAAATIAKPSDGLAVVGNEVWVANGSANSIYRYHFDGTQTKPHLTGNGMNRPRRLAVVGNQVWVVNTDGANSANTISRFNFDGTSAGSVISGNGLCQPMYLAVVGNQVWVTNYNWDTACSATQAGTISRFNFDGTSVGTMLSGNGMYGLYGISVVGQEVWVANYKSNTLSRFRIDGTTAGPALSGNSLDHPTFIGVVGNKVWVGNDNYSHSYTISQFNTDGTSGGSTITYPPINNVNPPYDIAVIQGASTSSPTSAPTPTPTSVASCGSTMQTVSLSQSDPALALPGDMVNNTLIVKNNDPANCSMTYTISHSFPSIFTLNGIPASFTLAGGETKYLPFTVKVGSTATAGNYIYQFWVTKQGQSAASPVNGSIQVAQIGPTNTPTPTPINCFKPWSTSLGSTSMSGNAGDTLQQTLTITNNNHSSCGLGNFAISSSRPSGWTFLNLPPSVTLAGGETKVIQFSITISTGAMAGQYWTQFWVNNTGPLNGAVNVLAIANPPPQQMFSNFGGKFYGSYATFEFSYNANGTADSRLDVATDPQALEQTTGPNSAAVYGFAYTSGGAWDASNNPTPSSIRGFIKSSPSSWSGWKCGATVYYRMYNSADLRIKSPIQSAVVDCTTVVDVLPWDPWYKAIYQGVYDSRYDADNNGVVNWTDYWILVRATRLR